jgi:hypothetical protein
MSQENIQEIEATIEEANEMIGLYNRCERLFKNKDFKEVIMKGYFENEAIRLTSLLGHPQMQGEQTQKNIINDLKGIAALQGYISKLEMQADRAKDSVAEAKQMLTEMNNSDGTEDDVDAEE